MSNTNSLNCIHILYCSKLMKQKTFRNQGELTHPPSKSTGTTKANLLLLLYTEGIWVRDQKINMRQNFRIHFLIYVYQWLLSFSGYSNMFYWLCPMLDRFSYFCQFQNGLLFSYGQLSDLHADVSFLTAVFTDDTEV